MTDTPQRELLGSIAAPSGAVLLIDGGMLQFWSHDDPPTIEEGLIGDAEIEAALNEAIDFRIAGPDALAAGKTFAFQWHPEFLYDIPPSHIDEVQQRFQATMQDNGLDGHLVPLDHRVPHNERARLAIEFGLGAGDVYYQRLFAVALGNLPTDRAMEIYGTRMADEEWVDYWHWVDLEVAPTRSAVRSEAVGYVAVEQARLLFGDLTALQHWATDEPLDGKADFLFWGRDAEPVAQKFAAPAFGNEFGWRDLPVDEVVRLGLAVEEEKEQQQLLFATDFRPHSHHYLLMEQVRSSEVVAGVVTLGDATVCLFATGWGDGAYPVYREVDAAGATVRIRIELGNEQIVTLMQALRAQWG
jgi:hypothetical protein